MRAFAHTDIRKLNIAYTTWRLMATMTDRRKIRKLFRANRGSIVAIARELGVTSTSVSLWLSGRMKSARIAGACERFALALQNREGE